MSPAKGSKALGDAFHLFLPHSTVFMSFKAELWGFLCTRTTSSPACCCKVVHGFTSSEAWGPTPATPTP
jgi:hypothetical protein